MKPSFDSSRLTREIHDIPDDVARALDERGLWDAYHARPPYQQNDWIGWICRAKLPQTRIRRLESMLSELEAGHGYMGMHWEPR